ncbi:MAG: diaminopimelate decarboxylase [Candidatus Lindowbacteria bacterium RIFCSPLOWO2_12_FULL_62_27]|nr:MAG: diaminopimelate decarboxylase [Candidatus Lindowbacteria bacterium RIFCSPLOWO2_12_FULL_62_27]OGH63971.1 MAG: diaminopimelate decarboxylase [Candidatus Lindowbacteria bacterium RIFCSPLOWO2_02_FULL_62_12]
MDFFSYDQGAYCCEGIPLDRIAAEFGTPAYVYSEKTVTDHYQKLDRALAPVPHLICYSVKTNSNLAILAHMARLGSGFDIVSGGELYRVLKAGGDASKVVFAGVGKTTDEMRRSIESGIFMFNIESLPEAEALSGVARDMNRDVRVAVRINPDVSPDTHHYITTGKKETKFGLPIDRAMDVFRAIGRMDRLIPTAVHCHIGSQITEIDPYKETLEKIGPLIQQLRDEGFDIRYFNLGGGLGIIYKEESPQTAARFAESILPMVKPMNVELLMEPGRFVVGNAGVLLTRVLYIKDTGSKCFAIVDAGMNDLVRPTLYGAYHEILPVRQKSAKKKTYDVVGPVCETGDFFAKDRSIDEMHAGDLLAIKSAGAYGFVMASNYNTRPRPPEIWVSGGRPRIARRRETYEDLVSAECDGIESVLSDRTTFGG